MYSQQKSQAVILANSPTNIANNQAQTSKSDMPLRIALFALPNAQSLQHALAKVSLSYLSLVEAQCNIVDITLNRFETDLHSAVHQLINDGSTEANSSAVLISNEQHCLLMLPALQAAKLKWPSHAILSSMQLAPLNTQSNTIQTLQNKAVLQAKLTHRQTDIKHHTYYGQNQDKKFAKLIAIINQLTTRTYQNNHHTAFWFSAPFKGRIATLTCVTSHDKSLPDSATCPLEAEKPVSSMLLSQGSHLADPKPLLDNSRLFFIITGENHTELNHKLVQLQTAINGSNSDIVQLMKHNLVNFTQQQHASKVGMDAAPTPPILTLVLQAKSSSALIQEITGMLTALPNALAQQKHYHTPAGSVFIPAPLGEKGLTFVYPGVGSIYSNMFNDLHVYFPTLFAQLEQEGPLSAMLQAEKVYCAHRHSAENQTVPTKTSAKLNDMSLAELAIAGVGSSYLFTQLLIQEFKLTPHFALGYSMGEAAMWASLGVWKAPHQFINQTLNSPLFTTMMSGPLTTVQQAWQNITPLQPALNCKDNPIQWNSFLVRANADEINALLPQYPRAYLAIIQGDTCIISGCEYQCSALLSTLKKRGIATNRVTAMHTPPAMLVHSELAKFYHQEVQSQSNKQAINTQFIVTSQAQAFSKQQRDDTIAITADNIAHSLADNYCQLLDFPTLVQKAQRKGAKLFLEVGADRQNTTLMDKIFKQNLKQQNPSHAMAINAKGGESITDILKVLAQLISHNVPVSIAPLLMSFKEDNPHSISPLSHDLFDKGEVSVFS